MSRINVTAYGCVLVMLWSVPRCTRVVTVEFGGGEKSYPCQYMKEVCAEADEFERKFTLLSKEEKEEMESVRQAYRSQCNGAIELCAASTKK